MYSLLGAAKLNGQNPEAYLREVLTRLNGLRRIIPTPTDRSQWTRLQISWLTSLKEYPSVTYCHAYGTVLAYCWISASDIG
jgi:hypothetical protein